MRETELGRSSICDHHAQSAVLDLPSRLDTLDIGHCQATLSLSSQTIWTSCPFSLLHEQINDQTITSDTEISVRRLFLPQGDGEFAGELLHWFKEQATRSGSGLRPRCSVSLDASLTKSLRRMWHRSAAREGLESASQGSGSERHLIISLPGSAPVASVSKRAKELWQLAQDAGGEFWELSQNELQQQLVENSVPRKLLEMEQLRRMAADAEGYIKQGNQAAVLRLLSHHPGVIWTRPPHGEYILPTACRKGLTRVVDKIIELQPSAKQQRSRQYGSLDNCISRNRNESVRDLLRAVL